MKFTCRSGSASSRIRCRKEFANESERADIVRAGCRSHRSSSAPRDERRATASKVTGVWRVFRDLPAAREANAVRMQEAPESLPVPKPSANQRQSRPRARPPVRIEQFQ